MPLNDSGSGSPQTRGLRPLKKRGMHYSSRHIDNEVIRSERENVKEFLDDIFKSKSKSSYAFP